MRSSSTRKRLKKLTKIDDKFSLREAVLTRAASFCFGKERLMVVKEDIPEKKEIKKVTSGKTKMKKRTRAQKFMDNLVSEDLPTVRSYVTMEVIFPAIKKAIADVVTNGIDMILYGETGRTKRSTPASRVSYRSFYDDRRDRRPSRGYARETYDSGSIVVDTRADAEAVLEGMDDLIATYGLVSIADMCDLAGVDSEYTDNKYGWTDIRTASIVHTNEGYLIKMPKALPI